ncbi:hypothetical protein F5Y03DRAFT_339793 [Xylaria venustula]|nr:hypothetical protein F5Y03DRAFT_339793 [Xylaria venustula]
MAQTSEETSLNDKSTSVDMRPESSPYASPLVTLQFADGPPFYVHSRLMDKSPKLLSCTRGTTGVFGQSKAPSYRHFSSSVGHVVVHYLFTGTYECLKPNGSSHNEKDIAEFTTSVRVYAFARDFELSELEKLSQGEMERVGNRLEVTQVFDVLSNTLPKVSVDDMWLQSYLKSLVRSSLIDNAPTQLDTPSASGQQTMTVANALFRVTAELWRDHTDSLNSKLHISHPNQDLQEKPAAVHAEVDPELNLEHSPKNDLGEASAHVDVDTSPREVAGYNEEIEDETKKKKKSKKEEKREKKKKKKEKSNETETADQRSDHEGKGQLEPLDQVGNDAQQKSTPRSSNDDIVSLFGTRTLSGSGFANTHGSILLNPLSLFSEEMDDIPMTIGAEGYFDEKQPLGGTINRLQHICAQERYRNYSPEELRWKHEFVIRISTFKAK